jgi:hypothetical protein
LDYILFGFGTGATLALGGWLFRDLGPRIRDRAPAEGDVLSAREMVSRMAWARFCAACGAALALAGIILMLATIGTAFWNPPDDEGFRVILIAYAVVTVLMLIWAGLFLRWFGAAGIIRPREAKPAAVKAEPSKETKSAGTGEAAAGAQVAPDAKTFDEVASARGGLGRFAAFFRRDTPAVDTAEELADARTAGFRDAAPAIGPVDTEMAAARSDDAAEKRLSPDDPLVTEVLGEIPDERVVEPDLEADLISDLSMPERDAHDVEDDNAGFRSDYDGDAEPEVRQELSPEDNALDLLRKKRLARLSGQHDE